MAYIGVSPSNGVRRVHTYTATASQTTFSGAGAEGTSLSYKDSNFVDVYQNGIKLGDADYTSTSGTSIVLAQGASVSDLVVVVVFDVFSVADTVSKADGGTFDGNVTMGGTLDMNGTELILDADADTSITSDTDDQIDFKCGGVDRVIIGADGSFTSQPASNGTIVFNEASNNVDFRVESDSMSHQLHMNGSNGKFTINANSSQSPSSHFTLFFASASYSAFAAQETDGGSGAGFFIARKSDGTTIGQIKRNGTADEIQYVTTSDYRLKENVNYDFDATSVTKQLKPCKFNWISDDTNTPIHGFLAHEVQAVVPHATSGEKDAMEKDEQGKDTTRIDPQGIDHSLLVPLLVKTIQELEARITALENAE